ncbi:MAG: restriction endonuclease [Treponema sp.]|nr:restriction endonuclease [Treponema sp.]
MKYWLHRISHQANISYPLLEHGFLSIGFSDFCTEKFYINVAEKKDWKYMDDDFNVYWGFIPRTRYNLWRFLAEMEKGDYVVVPTNWGQFSIYEISDNLPIMVTDSNIDLPQTDWNNKIILRDEETGLLKIKGDDGEKDTIIGIGYLRKVKIICKDISRSDFADSALTSRMKIRSTNADISDLEDSIHRAISSFKENKPINLKADLQEKTVTLWNESIHEVLNPDKYEKLVKWYLKKSGANEAYIPPKNTSDKVGDVDVIAVFENIKTIINVQVKFYTGETSDWAINQIKDFAKSKENLSEGYNRQYWVISSSDSFSEKSNKLAKENGILLIDGKQFATMLLNVGLDSLESFEV